MKPYRLVWFQHFHKAGGTSVVQLAERNGERFYPRHLNGNPNAPDGRPLELWEFDEGELSRFIDSCQRDGVTFVSTEWGLPLMGVLRDDPRVMTITRLREPLPRFVSNYFYDYYHGGTAATGLDEYVGSPARHGGAYTKFNYYCRVLARYEGPNTRIDEAVYGRAREVLAAFDTCTRLEDGLGTLSRALGWPHRAVHGRRTRYGLGKGLKFLARGEFGLVLRRLRHPMTDPPADFVQRFERENQWDLRLYAELPDGTTDG